ncbi:dihydroorotate dehydrogenase (quinone) [Muriicola marianensis]|uniref:Dihydroorotate dehydrogenase (quinone) n=2 Tax=Muriicola marianensis TaxID=1324801 RepID=A0ABQ1R5A9_9FLAO|nr:dihydroorotate dehydrogenase (quinone) [Muriicola marianensis]
MGKLGLSGLIRRCYFVEDPRLEREVFGLKFKNPVGLAAGFDKNAELYNELSDFGFGFVEIGTLTPRAQDGNPKKRLFRLKADQAIINRMGFNNKGVDAAVERLKKRHRVLIGGNIGKNKVTPNRDATSDYLLCFRALFTHVDYFVVNVSSPNTPGLRELQEKEPLTALLKALQEENSTLAGKYEVKRKPILLKIAPDLSNDQLLDIIDIVRGTVLDGVIATNTTIGREHLNSSPELTGQAGGLSGKPLRERSTEVIRFLHEKGKGDFPIIGVGGIHSPDDALEKLEAGASLVQLWTGFVYEGPVLVRQINRALLIKEAQSAQ